MPLNLLYIINKHSLAFLKLLCFIVFYAALTPKAFCQNNPDSFGHNFLFEIIASDKKSMVNEGMYVTVKDTALYRIFERFKAGAESPFAVSAPKSPILLGVKLKPELTNYFSALVQSVSKHYQTFVIADSSAAELIAMGINANNINNYQYRVVENDSTELISWSPIPQLMHKYGAKQPYGAIGKFSSPGKRLMIEVADKSNYGIRDGVIFDWRIGFKPLINQISVSTRTQYFNLAYTSINKGYATRFDNKTKLPLDFRFPADSVLNIGIYLKKQETLVQRVFLISTVNSKTDTTQLDFVDQYGYFQLDNKYFSKPGHYQIVIKKQQRENIWDDAQMLRLTFDVLAPNGLAAEAIFKRLLPYILAVIVLFIAAVLAVRFNAKQKLEKVRQQQATVQLKLKSIRSQLNPHFMFNALTSIQNLMNKNNLLEANNYMVKFAGLTRKVLNTSEEDMISLEDELKIASDYLEMEQLRFGFSFNINIDERLDIANIEVPAMLLQPFIENAVKHGIALLQQKGNIDIEVSQSKNNLILSVTDNGKGFDKNMLNYATGGFGLKLSYERVVLINQLYGTNSAHLHITSQPGKTSVTVTLNNWI